jgi:hypothetical protein
MSIEAIRGGFRAYFGDDGPQLPESPPSSGSLRRGGWTVRYLLNRDAHGAPVLDFLAEHGMMPAFHGRIADDGSAQTIGTFVDHYVFNPARDQDEDAARARMEQHNQEVADELRRVGLL